MLSSASAVAFESGGSAHLPLPDTGVDWPFALSPAFVEFLAVCLQSATYDEAKWFDQTGEKMSERWPQVVEKADAYLQRLKLDERASRLIERANSWFEKLIQGDLQALNSLHARCTFIAVIGIPRTGGTYLTAELFSALGYDKERVHGAIAHDGFPDARPFRLRGNGNPWIGALASMAQYLTAIELFFALETASEPVFIPKKATKAIYAPELFGAIFGRRAQYFVTVRHPIESCISTYERSGGLPAGGSFKVRSIMEQWIRRDNLFIGSTRAQLLDMSYFEAYIRYWEQYHIRMAMSGLLARKDCTVIPYGKDNMEILAARLHTRFHSKRAPEPFLSKRGLLERHPAWITRSEEALQRVDAVWRTCGVAFPVSQVSNCE
jgi:hypothetical protein